MIEVTYEMVDAAAQAFTTKPTEATYVVARRMIEAALKVHEANKPKPEPVGYIYKHQLEQMLNSTIDNDCNFFPIKDDISRVIFNRNRDKYLALYVEPPTREPLTTDDIKLIATYGSERLTDDAIMVARAIEKAHGIGVNK